MSSNKKTTTNATQTATTATTPTAPSWISDTAADLGSQIGGVKTEVPGLSGLQQDAVDSVSGQDFGGMFGDAAAALKSSVAPTDGGAISAKSGLDGVQSWLNPYLGEVVGATKADLDASDAQTRARQTLDMAGAGAFGGSGSAITRSLTEGELERARGTTLGGLRMGAFDSAAGNSQQDANRDLQAQIAQSQAGAQRTAAQQSAAQGLLNIGSTGIGLQADLGDTQRGVESARANSGLTDLAAQIGLFGNLPLDLLTGSTTTADGKTNSTSVVKDPIGQISQLLAAAGAAAKGGAAIMAA